MISGHFVNHTVRNTAATGTLRERLLSMQPGVYFNRETVAGASAGVVGTVLGYPLDVVKTRQQVSGSSLTGAFSSVYRESGLIGYYRGMISPLVSLTLLNTLNFSTYAMNRSALVIPDNLNVLQNGFEWRIGLAGATVGPISSLISTPFELIKTQMQLISLNASSGANTNAPKKFTNSFQAAFYIAKEHGVSALYRAFAVNTLREMVFLSTYFTVYEHLKSFQVHRVNAYHQSIAIPLAGGIAGATGWFVSFPLDCIKSNIQGTSMVRDVTTGKLVPAKSGVHVLRQLLATKGVLGLYSGVIPSILRAFIVSSSRFSAYEATLWLLS